MEKSSYETGDLQLDVTLNTLYNFQNKAERLSRQFFPSVLLQDIQKIQGRIIFHQDFIRENKRLHPITLEVVANIEEFLNQLDGGE